MSTVVWVAHDRAVYIVRKRTHGISSSNVEMTGQIRLKVENIIIHTYAEIRSTCFIVHLRIVICGVGFSVSYLHNRHVSVLEISFQFHFAT